MTDDFQVVRDTAAESLIWRAAESVISAVSTAWQHSSLEMWWQRTSQTLSSWTIEDRVRCAAVTLAIAGLVNIGLLWRSNPYSAPGIPRSVIAIAAAFASVIALWPAPFILAWSASMLGRFGAAMGRLLYKPAE